ncbi:hypothetical protein FVEN_g9551 [Fusarium venenatum]|uniref:Uncharacterized protein n=1 Tax=Fusarium venenatum TaxID=56646 RepID=A0A2L2TI94_9HYPO|nr:uncharacterized protein FVRRES_04255 [Fusarium venenatum]KAG8352425.1 hypothetical protein FVEN_g9551 [Fusarium venenatum]KAH7002795.1 hypothetical protein EDB82DRAFT_518867 [Fusarium venenatum]CEI67743.1 unnamed protein product [Fusarium venenatum]
MNPNSRRHQNPPPFVVRTDGSATPATTAPPVNYVLQSIPINSQAIPQRPAPMNTRNDPPNLQLDFWLTHTRPGDATSNTALQQQNPQALVAAQSTSYPPPGQPVNVIQRPYGYQVEGEWHIGYWYDRLQHRAREQSQADLGPQWNHNMLVNYDQHYRSQQLAVPGVNWPTPAVGMTTYQPVIQALQNTGISVVHVDQNGNAQWVWQGRN